MSANTAFASGRNEIRLNMRRQLAALLPEWDSSGHNTAGIERKSSTYSVISEISPCYGTFWNVGFGLPLEPTEINILNSSL